MLIRAENILDFEFIVSLEFLLIQVETSVIVNPHIAVRWKMPQNAGYVRYLVREYKNLIRLRQKFTACLRYGL